MDIGQGRRSSRGGRSCSRGILRTGRERRNRRIWVEALGGAISAGGYIKGIWVVRVESFFGSK
jgi:hypothetical protein